MDDMCGALTCGNVVRRRFLWGSSCSCRTGTSRHAGPGSPGSLRSRLTRPGDRAILVVVRRTQWRALLRVALVTAVLWGCAGAAPASHRSLPALDDTVVSQARGAVEHVVLPDSSFGAYGDYDVYLPAGYGHDPRRRYPVAYLLHGGSDSVSFFLELGAREVMDAGVRAGTIRPMILVMVDGGPTFTGDGREPMSFDDYLLSDLIPDVDRRWRTQAVRAIGGVSLGGRHALEFAADHPTLVAAVGGHSATMPGSPERLAAAGFPIYLDVGTRDGLFPADEALARFLRRHGADVQWHPAPGTHGRPYWSAHLAEYLRFYSEALGGS